MKMQIAIKTLNLKEKDNASAKMDLTVMVYNVSVTHAHQGLFQTVVVTLMQDVSKFLDKLITHVFANNLTWVMEKHAFTILTNV